MFLNSFNFIKVNKPRFFIFENVKGLLSHDKKDKTSKYGKTFNSWMNHLGGKSINGVPVLFPFNDSVPYHIYHTVLNAKNYGIPQNRERVFIIGIRDDKDNSFTWPKEKVLTKNLEDIIEKKVDKKYFLSDKMVNYLIKNQEKRALPFADSNKKVSNCVIATYYKMPTDEMYLNIGAIRGRNPEKPKSRKSGLPTEQMLEINKNGTSNALTTVQKDNVVVSSNSIRRLTPRECFRLMDFKEKFKFIVSDTQLYKQAGNSIPVGLLVELLKKLK